MTVSFNIEYRTSWGEEVRIAGLLPESIHMHTTDRTKRNSYPQGMGQFSETSLFIR